MQKILTAISFALPVCVLLSCHSSKNIAGTYRSKFAVNGFFGIRVNLNPDSTFNYRMSGDLVYDTAAGQFQIRQRVLILNYRPLSIDTTSEHAITEGSISVHEAITGNRNLHGPAKYIIGYHKLFLIDKNGYKLKRQWGYSKCRRYILFGKHWYMRRYYLKRIK